MLNVELNDPAAGSHSAFNIRHSTFNISTPLRICRIAVEIATRIVPRTDPHQRRLAAETDLHHVGTTGIELAPGRQTRDRRGPAPAGRDPPRAFCCRRALRSPARPRG